METQLELLIQLSAVDGKIAGVQKKLNAIPKAIDEKKVVVADAEEELEAAKEAKADMQKEHRQAEGALDGHLDKIRKLNDQTSMVKTNKEYQALLVEIEGLKSEQDKYEERILELMEKAGDVEVTIKKVEGQLADAKKVFTDEEGKLLAEAEGLRGELAVAEEERRALESSVERENIHTYNKVRGLRGDAVAEVRNELCLGCRVSVPPQKYADVIAGGSIQTCSHCQRILFYRPAQAEAGGGEG